MSGSGSAEKIAGSKAISKNTITKRVSNILVGESNKRYLYFHLKTTICVCPCANQCWEISPKHLKNFPNNYMLLMSVKRVYVLCRAQDEETVALNECLQLTYHQACRHHLILLYSREILILDLEINQTVGIIPMERTGSPFTQVRFFNNIVDNCKMDDNLSCEPVSSFITNGRPKKP